MERARRDFAAWRGPDGARMSPTMRNRRRLPDAPREGARQFAAHAQGLWARSRGLRRLPRPAPRAATGIWSRSTGSASAASSASSSGAAWPGARRRGRSPRCGVLQVLQVHHDLEIPAMRAARLPKLDKRLPTYLLDRRRPRRSSRLAEALRPRRTTSRRSATWRCSSCSIRRGLRLSELRMLDLGDARPAERPGEGAAARGARSGSCRSARGRSMALRRYLDGSARPLARRPGADRQAVFLSRRGKRLARVTVQRRMHRALRRRGRGRSCGSTRSGIPSPPTCWMPARTCGACRKCSAMPA